MSISPNQHRVLDPYITRIKQYNTFDSQIFLSKSINELINIYGNDFVVKGFYPIYTNYDNGIFEILLCGGIFVQDNVVIQINENINLLLDVSDYDIENGYLIIHPNYSYLDTSDNNDVRILLQYLSKDGNKTYPNGWKIDRDRLYFDLYEYNTKISKFVQSSEPFIRIKQKIYYYRGFNNNNLISLNYNLGKHYQSYNIQTIYLNNMSPPISIGDITDEYSKLIAYNLNIINLYQSSNMFDARYFGHNVIIDDIDNDNIYNIYNFEGNIVLTETEEIPDKLKKSKLIDAGLVNKYNRRQYELRSYNGNLVLEDSTFIENNICGL